MKQALQITFRDIPKSDAIEADIREKAAKLDQFYDSIMGGRVIVEAPHGHHHKGKLYHVIVDLTVPDGELVVNRDPSGRQRPGPPQQRGPKVGDGLSLGPPTGTRGP